MATGLHQRIFDKVCAHLMKQRRRSLNSGACMYRGDSGLRCAIGCLIKDKAYRPYLEGRPAHGVDVNWALHESGYPVSNADDDFLRRLQMVHDEFTPSRWAPALRRVARDHGLKMPPEIAS